MLERGMVVVMAVDMVLCGMLVGRYGPSPSIGGSSTAVDLCDVVHTSRGNVNRVVPGLRAAAGR